MNGTHQPPICAADDNLLGKNINTIKKTTEDLLDTSKQRKLSVYSYKISVKLYFTF
jgi:hypothetical protein